MRKFSIRPTLTLKGRTFKGVRGWSGKPLHPPLTDIPIAAYILAAGFDVLSAIGAQEHAWARELWRAATFTFIAGVAVSVLAAVTGLWDAGKSCQAQLGHEVDGSPADNDVQPWNRVTWETAWRGSMLMIRAHVGPQRDKAR
jgi:uncharacterized membrane protein